GTDLLGGVDLRRGDGWHASPRWGVEMIFASCVQRCTSSGHSCTGPRWSPVERPGPPASRCPAVRGSARTPTCRPRSAAVPAENLTRAEARERAAVVDVRSYDIALDLTTGPETFT